MARQMSTVIGKGSDSELEVEGQESVEFWSLLGGKAPYASDKRHRPETASKRSRKADSPYT